MRRVFAMLVGKMKPGRGRLTRKHVAVSSTGKRRRRADAPGATPAGHPDQPPEPDTATAPSPDLPNPRKRDHQIIANPQVDYRHI